MAIARTGPVPVRMIAFYHEIGEKYRECVCHLFSNRTKQPISDVQTYIEKLAERLEGINAEIHTAEQYLFHLSALKALVSQKTDYKEYTKEERLLVRNSILLVTLMYDMSKVTFVQKAENENSLETVNEKEVKRIVHSAKSSLSTIQLYPQTMSV